MIHLLLAWMLLARAGPAPEASLEETGDAGKSAAIDSLFAQARDSLEEGDAAGAAATLERLLADDPDNRAARLALGKAYLMQKKYQHALNAYSAVLLMDPEVPEANSGRALALAGLGDVPKAIIWAKKATEMAPDDLRAWEVLGEIYLTHNYLDAPRAVATFRQMLVLDPANRTARLQLARAFSYQKKVDEAIDLLRALAAEKPKDWEVQFKLAESYYSVRKFSRAEDVLIEVLAARPDHAEARRLLEAVQGSKSYVFWVPVIAVLAIPLLYLAFRKLKRGKVIKA